MKIRVMENFSKFELLSKSSTLMCSSSCRSDSWKILIIMPLSINCAFIALLKNQQDGFFRDFSTNKVYKKYYGSQYTYCRLGKEILQNEVLLTDVFPLTSSC